MDGPVIIGASIQPGTLYGKWPSKIADSINARDEVKGDDSTLPIQGSNPVKKLVIHRPLVFGHHSLGVTCIVHYLWFDEGNLREL